MKALGGKHKESPVSAAAVAALRKLGSELMAVGPVNSNERAQAHRRVLLANADSEQKARLENLFRELNLSF